MHMRTTTLASSAGLPVASPPHPWAATGGTTWVVQVAGDSATLAELAEVARASFLTLRNEGGRFVLDSSSFADAKSAEEVRARAVELLGWLAGAVGLSLDARLPLAVAGIHATLSDGRRQVFACVEDAGEVGAMTDGVAASQDHRQALAWVAVAARCPEAARMLSLWGAGPHDWPNLYQVYEIIRHSIGSDWQVAKRGWTSRKALDRFTEAAYTQAGARFPAPSRSRQMTLAEARGLVHGLAAAWLSAQVQ